MGLMINDVDLKTTYKFVTTDVNGRGAPPVERSTLEDLSFDGAIELGTKLAKRDISITGYVYGTSPTDARMNKDNLISFISQAYTDEVKITFPDTNRSIYAKLAGTPIVWQAQGPTLNAVAYSVTMNFVALDPYFYGSDFSAYGSDASGMIKLSTEAPLYLVDPRRSLYKREPKLEVYPVTVVNLLGKYGDFETDSNGDGIADGWLTYPRNWVYSIVNGRQRISSQTTGTTYNLSISYSVTPSSNAKVFVRALAKRTKTDFGDNALVHLMFGSNNFFLYFDNSTNDQIQYTSFVTNGAVTITLRPFGYFDAQVLSFSAYTEFDKIMVVDLNYMGKLPQALKEYFNNVLSTWADLATASNITAIDGKVQSGNAWLNELLPYVNSVATLGYAWGA